MSGRETRHADGVCLREGESARPPNQRCGCWYAAAVDGRVGRGMEACAAVMHTEATTSEQLLAPWQQALGTVMCHVGKIEADQCTMVRPATVLVLNHVTGVYRWKSGQYTGKFYGRRFGRKS